MARVHRRNNDKTRTLWTMFATILFMYSCGIVTFALELQLFLSYPDTNIHTELVMLVFGFTTVRHVPPHCAPSANACADLSERLYRRVEGMDTVETLEGSTSGVQHSSSMRIRCVALPCSFTENSELSPLRQLFLSHRLPAFMFAVEYSLPAIFRWHYS
jgi:hypothetical protein